MTLAVTLMIRDEADIVEHWLAWHVAQGVDVFVITDNGSTDGTREVLEAFARRSGAVVDLRHDPVHRKQQSAVVTGMARDAHVLHGADWVVNADADEFLVAKDRSLRLADVFALLSPSVRAFVVPVVNMIGPLAERGPVLDSHVWRDERTLDDVRAVGLLSHPSGNAIHVGDPDVSVVQGNHLVTLAAGEAPDEALALEVLHYPWRSWKQYAHRALVSGRAYEANPDAEPSPAHHGMRDYRRLAEGTLKAHLALRLVTEDEAVALGLTRDTTVPDFLRRLGDEAPPLSTVLVPADEAEQLSSLGRALVRRDDALEAAGARVESLEQNRSLLEATVRHGETRIRELEAALHDVTVTLAAYRARRAVRYVDSVSASLRTVPGLRRR